MADKQLEQGVSQKEALARALQFISSIQDSYTPESDRFVDYLYEYGISPETIQNYVQELEHTVIPGANRKYSAETFNKHVKAIKNRVRRLMKAHERSMTGLQRHQIEEMLKTLPTRRVHSYTKTEDEIPTKEEMQVLLAQAPKRLSLIMEFLLYSGARISEALNIMVGDVKKSKGHVSIRLKGKGKKEREVYVPMALYNRILADFDQRNRLYLFQHGGKTYNRNAITNEVRRVSGEIIGKKISPHDIRHRIGTDMTKKYGLWSAADYLGHSDIKVTQRYYNSNRVSAKHIKELYNS